MVDFTSNRHVSFPRGWYLYPTKNNGLLEIFHPKNGLPSKPFQPDENFSGSNLKRLGAKPLPELRQKEAPLLNFFGPQKGNKNASFLRPKMHHNYRTFFVGKKMCFVWCFEEKERGQLPVDRRWPAVFFFGSGHQIAVEHHRFWIWPGRTESSTGHFFLGGIFFSQLGGWNM